MRPFLLAFAVAASLAAGPARADQLYTTAPPYTYQPPAYSYTPPSHTYQPPGYTYTPPSQYRRDYKLNRPDYGDSYAHPRATQAERRKFGDPSLNRFAAPEAAPPSGSAPPRQISYPW